MKFIFILGMLAISAWAGWQTYPGIKSSLDKRTDEEQKRVAQKKLDEENKDKPQETATLAQATSSRFGPLPNDPNAASAVQNNNGTTVANAGTPAKSETTPPPPAVDPIDARYPMPEFKTIEEITKEWSSIPSRAFPRNVKTKVPILFDSDAGKITLPPNSDALAVGMTQGMLIVMPGKDKPLRQMVPLANTDLKESMSELYEKYKDYRRKLVEKQRDRARLLAKQINEAGGPERLQTAGVKPERAPDGVIQLLLEDIRARTQAGTMVELKEANITSWGEVHYEEIDGEKYWTGTLQCTVENAIFGPTPTEVMALVKNGKVLKWIYTGSREPVQ